MTQRVALLLDFFIVYSIYHIVSVIRYTLYIQRHKEALRPPIPTGQFHQTMEQSPTPP